MIGIVDVEVQAANPQMPLCPFVAFVGSPSSVRVRNVPGNIGSWNITKVYVSANYPDNSIQSRECTRVGEIYVGTLPACNAVGKGANGFVVSADGVDESGNAVTGYVLGKGDLEILDADGAITPGVTTHYVHGLDEQPSDPHEYDIYKDGDTWKIYFDGAWGPLAPALTIDDAVTPSSANAVKSSGIWSAIWGAISALPTGFTSLYDWCVSQLAGKQPSLTPGRMVVPGVIKSVLAAVKYQGTTQLLGLLTENVAINGNAFTGDVTLTGADIAVSDTDATKMNAALADKLDKSGGTMTPTFDSGTIPSGKVVFGTDAAGPYIGIAYGQNVVMLRPSEVSLNDRNVALAAGTGHAGNLAALDANGNPTDSLIPAANVALKGAIPYAISESTPLTVTSGAAATTLADRTHNVRTVAAPGSGNTTTISATLPPIVQGKSRDMFLNLTVGTLASDAGDISLSIVEPSGATVQIDIGSAEDIGIGKNEILISENALPTTSGNVITTHWLVTVRHEDFAS